MRYKSLKIKAKSPLPTPITSYFTGAANKALSEYILG
jgi:hypothetical protein